jgi:sec-independent protein translocase protein TatA
MPGPTELFIILAIALVIFGGKKLRSLGGDLGGAISEFKNNMNEDEEEKQTDAEKTINAEHSTETASEADGTNE